MTDTRALVKRAYRSFDAPQTITSAELAAAIAELSVPQAALKHTEASLEGAASKMIEDALRPIGAAIDPKMRPEDAKVWRKAMLLKLSDLPGPVLVRAARRAMHDPFEFFSEVEKRIRAHAGEVVRQQRIALSRLERWQREFERASAPALAAPPPKPLTQGEVDSMNAMMRKIGSALRWRLENGEAVEETG